MACTKGSNNESFNKILNEWNKHIGPYYGKADKTIDSSSTHLNGSGGLLQTFVTTVLNKPFHQNWKLSTPETDRMIGRIRKLGKNIQTRPNYISPVVDVLFSGETTSINDPVAREMVVGLNNADNFKRIQIATHARKMATISQSIREEFIDRNIQGRYTSLGIPYLRAVDKHQFDITSKTTDIDIQNQKRQMSRMWKADQSLQAGRRVVDEYVRLTEVPNAKRGSDTAKALKASGETFFQYDIKDGVFSGKYVNIVGKGESPNLLKAAADTKVYLHEMGKVYKNGLVQLRQAILEKYTPLDSDVAPHKSVQSLIDAIKRAENRLDVGMEKGAYFPVENLNTMIGLREAVNEQISNVKYNIGSWELSSSDLRKLDKTLAIVDSIGKPGEIPNHLRGRSQKIDMLKNNNPLSVLDSYGMEAVAFNKINFVKHEYIRGLKRLHNSKVDLPYLRGVQKYLTDMYTISVEGISQRPDFINETNDFLTTLMTVSTMSLNPTGALKNLVSVVNYHSTVGLKEVLANNRLYEKDSEIERLTNIAQREEGFLFKDIGKSMVVEGLVTEEQAKRHAISFDIRTGNVTFDGSPIKKNIGIAKDWTLDKLLVMHQITENIVRSHIYKNSFIGQIKRYKEQPEYWETIGEPQLVKQAKAFALNMVNNTAFNYAIHNKSKLSRGPSIIDKDGDGRVLVRSLVSMGTSQTFHMMHYPFSLAERHLRTFKGGMESIKYKQWNSDELVHMMRYASMFAGLQITDILMNARLSSLADNTTIETLKGIYEDLTMYDNPNKNTFGVLNRLTGPMPGKIEHLLNIAGVHGMEKSEIAKMLLGNASLNNKKIDEKTMYMIATILGQGYSKYYPSIKEGAGWEVTRHAFNAYPTKFTNEWNKFVMGRKSKKKTKPRKSLFELKKRGDSNMFNSSGAFGTLMTDLEKIKGTA